METVKYLSDFWDAAELCGGIADGVISESEKWSQLGLIQFLHAFLDVLIQYKFYKGFLLVIVVGIDLGFSVQYALLAGLRTQGKGDIGEDIE